MVATGFALPDGAGINASSLTCENNVHDIRRGNMLAATIAERHGVQIRK